MEVFVVRPPKRRYWLHALLLLATILTTLIVGAGMQYDFTHDLPAFSSNDARIPFFPAGWALAQPSRLLLGVPFSLSLMLILLSHEMGHFLYCVRYRIFATLPYFVPFPSLIGTLGAFIRIKSPIRSRAALLDIGIAGPIAGFVVACFVLLAGLSLSKPLPTGMAPSEIQFGFPLIFQWAHRLLGWLNGGHVHSLPLSQLYLHPVAVAAWVGMFATSLNLLPGGQLDGGHIVYAVAPRAHRWVTIVVVFVLIPLGWYWHGWWLWSVMLTATGWVHPRVEDWAGLDRSRRRLALFGLLLLVLTFVPNPIRATIMPR